MKTHKDVPHIKILNLLKKGKNVLRDIEFANFSGKLGDFADEDSLRDRGKMDAKSWWIIHGSHAPILQNIALKLLGQPCSSSCCERN